MPRPRKHCRIGHRPLATFYKPQGIPLTGLEEVLLSAEGMEALRLVDAEGLSQEDAALRMGVSRPTVCRILGEARAQVARALTRGWAIRIESVGSGNDAEAERNGVQRPGRGKGRMRRDREMLQNKEDV